MEPKHIALFVKHLTVGGLEKIMVCLANEFARRGYLVDLVLVKGEGPLAGEVASNVRIIALESKRMWGAVPNLLRYLEKSEPDVLLAAGVQVNVIAVWAKLLGSTRFRLVLSVHSNMTQYSKNAKVWYARFNPLAIKLFYPFADAIIAVSQGVRSDLSEISRRAGKNADVVYNPVVDTKLMKKSAEELSHPWFTDEHSIPVLLGVGRMDPPKNFAFLVRAFAELRRHREARLVFLGDGKMRQKLEMLTHKLGLQDKVDFAGVVKNPYSYMANASLLVVSSRFEGFGIVIVEALACGCPVVSTDCPSGPREILEDGKWGRLVPVGEEEALAEAMEKSLSETHDADRLRQRAMDFSVDKAVEKYLDVLIPTRTADNQSEVGAFTEETIGHSN
jgi:glycosyltransferase involved in cell wall biosynthesis